MRFRRLLPYAILAAAALLAPGGVWGQALAWEELGTLPQPDMNILAVDDHGIFHAGHRRFTALDTGTLFVSRDAGRTWSRSVTTSGITIGPVVGIMPLPGGIVLAAGDSLYRSSDEGRSWEHIPLPLSRGMIRSFRRDSSGNVYIMALDGIYRSNDAGLHWHPLGFPADQLLTAPDGTIYALGGTDARSTNGGATWVPLNASPTMNSLGVSRIQADPGGGFHVLTYVSEGFGETNVIYHLAVDDTTPRILHSFPIESPGDYSLDFWRTPGEEIYYFTGTAAYRSTDAGATFDRIDRGLFSDAVAGIFTTDSRGYMYITLGTTIYRSARRFTADVATSPDRPAFMSLRLPAAGPRDRRLPLLLDLPAAGDVQIGIIDMRGITCPIVRGMMEQGTHRLSLDLSRFPPGIYLLRAECDEATTVTKVLLR